LVKASGKKQKNTEVNVHHHFQIKGIPFLSLTKLRENPLKLQNRRFQGKGLTALQETGM